MRSLQRLLVPVSIVVILVASCFAQTGGASSGNSNALLSTMQQELTRAMLELKKNDPPPYFMSYSVKDSREWAVVAAQGGLITSIVTQTRFADISTRVGSPALDNTHNTNRASAINTVTLPIEDDRDAIARVLWATTDRGYRDAVNGLLQVKARTEVRAKEEDSSPDFSSEAPHRHLVALPPATALNQKFWEDKVREYSAIFRKYPDVLQSSVILSVEEVNRYFVSTEGTEVVTPSFLMRLVVFGTNRANDGMDMTRAETFEATSVEGLPPDGEIRAKIEKIALDLQALRKAPVIEPFSGPALLSGRAAAVFFHEVLGHRLEGHRQRGDEEGQTFAKQVNEKVLPEFLSVADDPTVKELAGLQLSGYYEYDDEGEVARRSDLIKDGVLKSFLMSRLPVKEFAKSNGHGRAQTGFLPTGRQGNLIITSSKTIKDSELRQQLIAEAKKQGKPYGLYFEDISGGFTLTGRTQPQAFVVNPVMVYRIFTDGRPDELVRGVNIVGTPLMALNRITLTGDELKVFNGQCGAESGAIPVSAVAPAMLISEIEVAKQDQNHERLPILPPPGAKPEPQVAVAGGENESK